MAASRKTGVVGYSLKFSAVSFVFCVIRFKS